MNQPEPNSKEVIYEALLKANAEIDTYRKALEAIIADPEADAVQIAHQAIMPYTTWIGAGPEASAALDKAAGVTRG